MVFDFGWYVFGAGVCALAVLIDTRTRKIPNWLNALTAIVMIAGLVLTGIHHSNPWLVVAGHGLGGLLLPLGLLAPLFIIRALGAGDIKLMMALGILWGPWSALYHTLFMALAGGLIAGLVFAYHVGWQGLWGLLQSGGRGLSSYQALKIKFPYSLAILASYAVTLWWRHLI